MDFGDHKQNYPVTDSVKFNEEFDLPILPETDLPSLESILLENDDDIYNFEDLNLILNDKSNENNDDGTTSMLSEMLPAPRINLVEIFKAKKPNHHGSVLRHVVLRKVSSQMIDACNRRDAGLPTAMAVSSVIAIGTSHGIVLVFEPKDQVLKLVLGTTADGEKYGAVTALGINVDCNRLLCGYARGQITMWDLDNGSCLRVITEAHPTGYAVLHIQFTDDPTIAMLNDSSGSVYTLNFKRLITRTCESTCFFSGSKGEVCTMVPLHISPNLKDSPMFNSSLLAMASLTKLIVVNMKPRPTAVFTKKLAGPQECLPLLAWHFTLIDGDAKDKQVVPVLAFARNKTILFFKVIKNEEEFGFLQWITLKLNYTLVAMNWLNSQILVTIDTYERIRIIDVRSGEELECLDLVSVQLVYGSSYFKSLATGGNVSVALKAASDYACYQSVQVFNGQLILLGTKSVHCLQLRHWKDRLDFFVRRNEFLEGLALGKSFYEDKAKALVGLTGSRKKKQAEVAEEISSMLLTYLGISMAVNCPKTNDENVLTPYFRSLVPTSISYCLLVGNLELLFEDVYDHFADDSVARKEFLEGLENYILDDKLTSLSPVIMRDLIEHYEATAQLDKLQACLVHLDLASVDIDYMVKLCWTHHLYDLVIYVFTKGLHDYITPLEKLIKILRDDIDRNNGILNDDLSSLGYKILVYLSCCLAGNQYPLGKISSNYVKEVKDDIFNSIILKKSEHSSYNESYPHIRTLLMFDTREFLNVLSLAFEEKEFEPLNEEDAVGSPSKRQKIVDVLLEVMVNDVTFLPSQVGCLFTFIARQMAKYEGSIQVNRFHFEQVLEFLTNPDEEQRHEEREQALLELMYAGGLQQFPVERVLALAESAKFYRVCENIYQNKRQYEKVLSCYWRDSARRTLVFAYIDKMLLDESFTDFDKDDFSTAVLNSMNRLVEINSMKFARLILTHFSEAFNDIEVKLEGKPEIKYAFLKGVFQFNTDNRIEKSRKEFQINPEVHESFIELMCRYEPEMVHQYLLSNDAYRLEQALAIVQSHNLIKASAFLLERMGDTHGAFQLLCDDLKKCVENLNQMYLELPDVDAVTDEVETQMKITGRSLQCCVQLCQRNNQKLEVEDREAMWFPLLETVMAPQRRIKNTRSNHFLLLKEFTKEILVHMMHFISLPAVLQKIMQDPAYSSGKFGEIKELILGMLDTYNYELTLLETTTSLLGKDLHGQYQREKVQLTKGFRPAMNKCCLCLSAFVVGRSNKDDIILFRCEHSYHRQCLQGVVGFDEELICVQCKKTNVISTATNFKRSNSRSSTGKSPSVARKRGKTKETLTVDLDSQQENALNGLWNHNKKVSKVSILSELNGDNFANWASKTSSRALTNVIPASFLQGQPNSTVDDKFLLRLAPPPLQNGKN